jgi:hypothetical protein
MKQQHVTHTVHQTEILTLLWVTNVPSIKMYPQTSSFSLYFHKNVTCLDVDLLQICQVLSVSFKIVYKWARANCCSLSVSTIYGHLSVHPFLRPSVSSNSDDTSCSLFTELGLGVFSINLSSRR